MSAASCAFRPAAVSRMTKRTHATKRNIKRTRLFNSGSNTRAAQERLRLTDAVTGHQGARTSACRAVPCRRPGAGRAVRPR
jgi:hypothetical protein